jgi:hypothetical protein
MDFRGRELVKVPSQAAGHVRDSDDANVTAVDTWLQILNLEMALSVCGS